MSCLFIFIALLLSSCVGSSTAFDQTCGNKIVKTVFVDQAGSGNFGTVQAAIDSVQESIKLWIKIKVKRGDYVEQVKIPAKKQCIIVEGEGRKVTTIMYSAHQQMDASSTFISEPSYVVVRDISIMNTHNRGDSEHIKPAVAISIYGDKLAFYNCGFYGLQDTLLDNRGRHYFKNCYIEGAIDFIYGNGQSVYEDCEINATAGALASKVRLGYITAQGRESESETSGYVFLRGSVTGNTNVYLGRPYREFSRVFFIQTYLSAIVHPKGWNSGHYSGHELSFTYAEVECKGPGSNLSGRVPWINKLPSSYIKQQFSTSNFIDQDEWISNIPHF